jgi:ABC-2 type transport system ATP-binding protein
MSDADVSFPSSVAAPTVATPPQRSVAAADVAIHVQGVVHAFKGRRALDDVSFQVHPKSLHGFVGPNGAGKTTSLRIICTLLRPQLGMVKVFGRDVVYETREVRRNIGFMPDHFSTYRQMTVFEYLDFFAAAYGLSLQQRNRVIDDVLSLTDMGGRRDDLIGGLSRGMQQRVSLARVLVNDPQLLLLDEPASGLDPRARIELMEILKALRSMGKTIFISSHILSELAELCDSVTIIDRGKIRYSGPMHDLLAKTGEHAAYRLSFAQLPEDCENRLKQLPGVMAVEPLDAISDRPDFRVSFDEAVTTFPVILRQLLEWGWPLTAFTPDRRHLNEAFMDLTERGVR